LPLVQEEWFGGTVRSWQTAMPEGTYAVLVERLEQADVLAMPDSGSREEAVPVWPMFLVGLYLAGVTMSLAIRLWQWVCMRRFVSPDIVFTKMNLAVPSCRAFLSVPFLKYAPP
jgi:hypothetical protein